MTLSLAKKKNLNKIPKNAVIKDETVKAFSVPHKFIMKNKVKKITIKKVIPRAP